MRLGEHKSTDAKVVEDCGDAKVVEADEKTWMNHQTCNGIMEPGWSADIKLANRFGPAARLRCKVRNTLGLLPRVSSSVPDHLHISVPALESLERSQELMQPRLIGLIAYLTRLDHPCYFCPRGTVVNALHLYAP